LNFQELEHQQEGKRNGKTNIHFPYSPSILAKSQREVNKLSKYFKKNSNPQQKKSYANATSLSNQHSPSVPKNIVKEMLKIKETFPNLSNKKIEQV